MSQGERNELAVKEPLLRQTPAGLYCARGDFYVDPSRRVARALITHAHADHARPGSQSYICSRECRDVLRLRLGPSAMIETLTWGETLLINGVRVSFHPAGHILGSAQIRIESHGEIWVVTGDYKTDSDPTCTAFESVRCHTLITESTFGLPIFQWAPQATTFAAINRWWCECRDAGQPAVIFAYSLGKAQRILAGVDSSIGPIFCHPTVQEMNAAYAHSGISLPNTMLPSHAPARKTWGGVLYVTAQGASTDRWPKGLKGASTATASGWMMTRRMRKGRTTDRPFVLSDHADWPGLLDAISQSKAENVVVTHGFSDVLARYLTDKGHHAMVLKDETTSTANAEQ